MPHPLVFQGMTIKSILEILQRLNLLKDHAKDHIISFAQS